MRVNIIRPVKLLYLHFCQLMLKSGSTLKTAGLKVILKSLLLPLSVLVLSIEPKALLKKLHHWFLLQFCLKRGSCEVTPSPVSASMVVGIIVICHQTSHVSSFSLFKRFIFTILNVYVCTYSYMSASADQGCQIAPS